MKYKCKVKWVCGRIEEKEFYTFDERENFLSQNEDDIKSAINYTKNNIWNRALNCIPDGSMSEYEEDIYT